jgi:hypothetical protein
MANRYQLKLDPIVYSEFIFALINGLTVFLAIHARNWVIAAYAGMFCAGLLFTSGTTLFQSLFVSRRHAGDSAVPDRRFG